MRALACFEGLKPALPTLPSEQSKGKQSELGCGKQFQERNSAEDGSSSMYYTLTVFPNSCGQYPPYDPGDWGY